MLSRIKFFFIFLLLNASFLTSTERPTVIVSVAPHKFFVEKIGGETIDINLFVPANASSHAFEPTPKQMIAASHTDLWFGIGEPFETRALKALENTNSKIQFVDLREGVNLIHTEEGGVHSHHCCHANHADLHIWLSLREAKTQAQHIANALSDKYPEHKDLYKENLNSFSQELDNLDHEITQILSPLKHRIMMVSHPAYGYFVRDYQISQMSVEFEGKDPTPRQLTQLLDDAKKANISTIFIQMQYNNKGARLVADQLHANVVMLDPYSENYMASMKEIALALAAQEK